MRRLTDGRLVDRVWKDQWCDTTSTGGRSVRWNVAVATGSRPVLSVLKGRKAASGPGAALSPLGFLRLSLAHRTLTMRGLKGLEGAISLSVTH